MQLIETISNTASASIAVGAATIAPDSTQLEAQPEPLPAENSASSDGVFVNQPAEQVAAQLSVQPPAAGRPTTNPASGSPQQSSNSNNVTLAAIEQHPEQYLQPREAVNPETQNQNQP
jgi:hypothetical protein